MMASPFLPGAPAAGRGRSSRDSIGKPRVIAGPVKGLRLFEDISNVPDGGAVVLDNWVVQSDTVRPRNGNDPRNTGLPNRTRAFAVYRNGSVNKLFSFSGVATQAIYDVSTFGPVGAPLVSGLAATEWSTVQFATPGGAFLIACGAGNSRLVYDGSTWSTSPAITGVSMSSLSQVFLHGSRQWFIEAGTLNAWYLPVDSIGGAATKFPLGGLFSKGGTLVAGASWSYGADGGGMQATAVFVSSEGEIAVYQGSDPSTNFEIKDVYRTGKPCGINCFMKTDGDLAIMTEAGLFPMSQIVQLDAAALADKGISRNIRPLWLDAAKRSDISAWKIIRRDTTGYAIVSVPKIEGEDPFQFVANLQTGAWSRWTGWDVLAMAAFGDELVFAGEAGTIFNGEKTGADDGNPFTAIYVGQFRGNKLRRILPKLGRVAVRSMNRYRPKITALVDYNLNIPSPPQSSALASGSLWDDALWDQGKWSGGKVYSGKWQTLSGIGATVAPCVQFTFGQTNEIDLDFIRTDFIEETGSVL
jgi:hypothetical protein